MKWKVKVKQAKVESRKQSKANGKLKVNGKEQTVKSRRKHKQ